MRKNFESYLWSKTFEQSKYFCHTAETFFKKCEFHSTYKEYFKKTLIVKISGSMLK